MLSFKPAIEADQKAEAEATLKVAKEVDDLEAMYAKQPSIVERIKDVLR